MIKQYGKRVLSFVLALIMILSVMPGRALAAEEHDHDHESEEILTPSKATESEALVALRAEIAAYIEELGITPDMSDAMLLNAYRSHKNYEAAQASLTIQDEFEKKVREQLSWKEQKILYNEENTQLALRYREVVTRSSGIQLMVASETSYNPVEQVKVSYSNENATSQMDDAGKITFTAEATSTGSGCDTKYTATTLVVYIESVNEAASGLSKELLYMKFLQGVPIVGAAGGAYDVVYMKKVGEYAKLKYNRRLLLRKKKNKETRERR